MDPPVYDTLILSDLHLGSETSRAGDALRVLKENRFRRLILLGDIFADLNFRRLTKEHWKFLGYIRKLSNPKRGVEVIWVEGNHDHGLTEVMSHLVGVRVYQEYFWEYQGLKHLAIHGHQFDRLLANNLRLNYFGTLLLLQLQKLDVKGKPLSRLIDRLNTRWLRMSPNVAAGAKIHARLHKVDRIFCGHTHEAIHEASDGHHYYNCGGWVGSIGTYITIDSDGVRIHTQKLLSGTAESGAEQGKEHEPGSVGTEHDELLEEMEYEKVHQ